MALPINDTRPRVQYTATAAQTSFAVPFEFFDKADLKVYNGSTLLTYDAAPANGTKYSVTGAGIEGGGSITLGTGGAGAGDTITIYRDVAVERVTDFPLSGPFQIASLNTELARLTAMVQQLEARLDTRVPEIDQFDTPSVLGPIPAKADRASKYAAWDSDGNPSAAIGSDGTSGVLSAALAASGGSSGIGFLQSGTGAVARTAQAKLRDTVSVKDFGAVGDGTTDDTTAIQAALTAAGAASRALYFPAGDYLCTSDLTVPLVASRGFIDIRGENMKTARIVFSGTSPTNGLYYNGISGYEPGGALTDISIIAAGNATRGVTIRHCYQPLIQRAYIWGFKGAGIYMGAVLMASIRDTLVQSCGSAAEGEITVTSGAAASDVSTTLMLDHVYVSDKQTGGIAGLMVDRCIGITIKGGAYESCGAGFLFGSRTEGTYNLGALCIDGPDIENCSPYISIGSGWTGAAGGACESGSIKFYGSPSGATSIPKGVVLYNCTGLDFSGTKFSQTGIPTASYSLEGTGNRSIAIRANRSMYGFAFPFVTEDGTMRKDATPYVDWCSDAIATVDLHKVVSGTTFDAALNSTQGGIYRTLYLNNGGATNVTNVTWNGAALPFKTEFVMMGDGQSTLMQTAGGTGQMGLRGAVNKLLGTFEAARFFVDDSGRPREV